MATIKLLNSDKIVLIDDDMHEELSKHRWFLSNYRDYAVRSIHCGGRKHTSYMHRIILGLQFGNRLQADHINGNGLDNRNINLRICTHQQNLYNKMISKHNSSGFKGVYWHKRDKKWQARLSKEGRRMYLGDFTCPIEAARAYNKAALKHHGEFARLNKIPEGKEVDVK